MEIMWDMLLLGVTVMVYNVLTERHLKCVFSSCFQGKRTCNLKNNEESRGQKSVGFF